MFLRSNPPRRISWIDAFSVRDRVFRPDTRVVPLSYGTTPRPAASSVGEAPQDPALHGGPGTDPLIQVDEAVTITPDCYRDREDGKTRLVWSGRRTDQCRR